MAISLASPAPSLTTQAPADVACLHCGDPCGGDIRRTRAGSFCCAGCEAVYTLLSSHELTAFYTCDVNAGRSQRAAARRRPDRFAVLDDPAVASRFMTPVTESTARATFRVPAVHCASCVWLLERLWRFDAGIGRSEVDVVAETVRVDFDPARTSVRAIAERLASLGYEPVLDGEPRAAMPESRRELYTKLGVAGFAFGNVMLFSIPRYLNGEPLDPFFQRLFDGLNLALTVPVFFYSASDYLKGAARAIAHRQITLDVPIAMGLTVLFGRSIADVARAVGPGFFDSFAGLVFFLLIGRLFQQKAFERIAFDRSVRSFLPLAAYVEDGASSALTPIDRLKPGDVVRLRPAEVVPADAVLVDDEAWIDNAFVTGEQDPVRIARGERVSAGGRVADRAVRFRVERPVSHARLAELWANPVFSRAKASALGSLSARFGAWFTLVAIALAVGGALAWWPDGRMSADVATAVLIIACPCALTLAAPIAVGTSMTVLGRAGLYLKESAVVMNLSRVDTVVFDKTGTLTTAAADRAAVPPETMRLAGALASHSVHPFSRALAAGAPGDARVSDLVERPGLGVSGIVDGHQVAIGSAPFAAAASGQAIADGDEAAWIVVDGGVPQPLRLSTSVRAGVAGAIASLSRSMQTWLLSGDRASDRSSAWRPLFGDRVKFGQTPDDKLTAVTALESSGRRVLMLGDGLNDAGALAAASVGIAVSDDTACLVPACDAVLEGRSVRRLPALLAYARRTPRVIAVCFAVSVLYNVVGIGLALAGALTPLAAAVLMPVSSMTIVALSTGLMRAAAPGAAS